MRNIRISPKTQNILWALSGGRCQYEGCNKILHRDLLTKRTSNKSYIAHIVAYEPTGPRGDIERSELLAKDIQNLMLLCDECHRRIDREDVEGHSESRLLEMKRKHEERIELLTSLVPNKESEIIVFCANVGEHNPSISFQSACDAILYDYYPASKNPIGLGYKNSSLEDNMNEYWIAEVKNLESQVDRKIKNEIMDGVSKHYSLFALAPQPLLIKLGVLLNDIHQVRVFQKHREPDTWKWQQTSYIDKFIFQKPAEKNGIPVLALSLSGTISKDRITDVLGDDASIWEITIDTPNNDFLKTEDLLTKFREKVRVAFDMIKAHHGCVPLHIFPAMPVSTAVEFGRIWMPKADMPLVIYDQRKDMGGFYKTITIK